MSDTTDPRITAANLDAADRVAGVVRVKFDAPSAGGVPQVGEHWLSPDNREWVCVQTPSGQRLVWLDDGLVWVWVGSAADGWVRR